MYSQIGQKTEPNRYGPVLSGFVQSQDRFRPVPVQTGSELVWTDYLELLYIYFT